MRVLVASANPVKIDATRRALAALDVTADVADHAVIIDVPAQPMGDDETLRGATLRAEALPAADLRVGIEGGVCDALGRPGVLDAMAWVVALASDRRGVARTATFELPASLTELIRAGVELGHADDRIFGHTNSKQQGGTIGTLSGGVIDRTAYYEHAVTLALLPVLRGDLYTTR